MKGCALCADKLLALLIRIIDLFHYLSPLLWMYSTQSNCRNLSKKPCVLVRIGTMLITCIQFLSHRIGAVSATDGQVMNHCGYYVVVML